MAMSQRRIVAALVAALLALSAPAWAGQEEAKPGDGGPEAAAAAREAGPARDYYLGGYREGEEYMAGEIADPLEPLNRIFFELNDKLYFAIIRPAAQVYGLVVPEWGRQRVDSFFRNLAAPIRFVGCVLQLKFKAAGNELARFALNTTGGMGGLFDIAAEQMDLPSSGEDLGQALGSWGIGHGFYIVWPVLGPSSLRDSVGTVGDNFLYPVNYLEDKEAVLGVRAYEYLNRASLRIGDYEDLREVALDPYISVRNAYFQYREAQLGK